ncbi:MAG: ATP-binding cassette domain-containing protein, partial [Catenibacillus sp.]
MLELQNISFDVDENDRTKGILKNISLKLEDNKFYVITGPNGGGKSTLAKVIAGIYKPSGGKILWNGEDITRWSVTE